MITAHAVRVILSVRCQYCSKFRSPEEIATLSGNVRMCHQCYEWHGHALKMLASAEPPPGCQECGIAYRELESRDPDGNVRMYVHPKDGIYQVLCTPCSDRYARKRADLYGETDYGHAKQIDGSK